MKHIIFKSGVVAMLSAMASVVIVYIVSRLAGSPAGPISMSLACLCPLVITGPLSAHRFLQNDRLTRALDDLRAAHAELEATHTRLAAAHSELEHAHASLAEKARHDEMTGMLNRESFFETIEANRRRTDHGTLLIVDADYFKKINDTHGHLVGDQALRRISAAIRRGVRERDVLGRIGGEEFGIYVVGADRTEAANVAERVRSEVEAIEFFANGMVRVPLTVSIGVAANKQGATLSDLMRRADRKLYDAKRGGRNLVAYEQPTTRAA